ncbi:hypothetical protein MCERE19_02219 [Spirosomataceae bacterium]|jgi:hypothetical protein
MGKLLSLLNAVKLPSIGNSIVIVFVIAILSGVGIIGFDYSQKRNQIEKLEAKVNDFENEQKQWILEQRALMDVQDSLVNKVQMVIDSARTDRKNYAEREAQLQLTLKQVIRRGQDALQKAQVQNDSLESYVEKLESGNYEVKMGVWPFKSKRLVPKK